QPRHRAGTLYRPRAVRRQRRYARLSRRPARGRLPNPMAAEHKRELNGDLSRDNARDNGRESGREQALEPVRENAREQTARARGRPDAAPQTVLIVDDEEDIRELLQLSLLRMGLAVECAGSVAEAKALLAGREFD